MKDIETIKNALKYKDHFEVGLQLDSSFQRVYLVIRDREIISELKKNGATWGTFSLELFRNKEKEDEGTERFDLLDHIDFLSRIKSYAIKPNWWSTNGRVDDIGAGLLIVLSDETLFRKLSDALAEKRGEFRLKLLNLIGGHREDIEVDDFFRYKDEKIKYHQDKLTELEKEIADYVVGTDKYQAKKTQLEKEKEFVELLISL